VKRLKQRYGVDVDMSEPKVPYRETLKAVVKDAEYKHKKQSGGHGQYGHVHLRLEPLKRGQGFEFLDESLAASCRASSSLPWRKASLRR